MRMIEGGRDPGLLDNRVLPHFADKGCVHDFERDALALDTVSSFPDLPIGAFPQAFLQDVLAESTSSAQLFAHRDDVPRGCHLGTRQSLY